MDILNIQSLISQGLLTDMTNIDPAKAYLQVGIYQPGNRQKGSGNAEAYKYYAVPVSAMSGTTYTASNGISIVGVDIQLTSNLISQFTNDAGYTAGTGTIGTIPVFTAADTVGDSSILEQTDYIKFTKGNIMLGGLATALAIPAIYMGVVPTVQNYVLAYNAGNTYINGLGDISFAIAGSVQGSVKATGFYFNNNVGIGTGAVVPTEALCFGIRTATGSTSPYSINMGGSYSTVAGTNLKFKLYDDSGTIVGFGMSAGRLDYQTNTTNIGHVFYNGVTPSMVIGGNATTNIGMGTTTPAYKLDVVGEIRTKVFGAAASNTMRLESDQASATLQLDAFNTSQSTSGGGKITIYHGATNIANIATNTSNQRFLLDSVYDVQLYNSNTLQSIYLGTGGIYLNTGSANRLTIADSGLSTFGDAALAIDRVVNILSGNVGSTTLAIKNDSISRISLYNVAETEETMQLWGYHGIGGIIKAKTAFYIRNHTNNQAIFTVDAVDTNPHFGLGNHLGSGTSANDTRLRVIGQTSTSADYAFKAESSSNSPLLFIRNDGLVSMPNVQVGNASLSSGDLYVDTAANILSNGDLIVGRKV